MSKKVEKRQKKRGRIKAEYDPDIADLETQNAKLNAEATLIRERIQSMLRSKPPVPVPKSLGIELRQLQGDMQVRGVKILHLKNEKRIKLLEVDFGNINKELERIAEEAALELENEQDRQEIIGLFEAQMMNQSMKIDSSSATMSEDELRDLGFASDGSYDSSNDSYLDDFDDEADNE